MTGLDERGAVHDDAHELRVLDGPQRGARLTLEPGRGYRVGRRWGADVLLRAPGAAASPASLAPSAPLAAPDATAPALAPGETAPEDGSAECLLTLLPDGRLEVRVLAGGMRCGGRWVRTGQIAHVAALQPLELDGTRVAVGPPHSAGWEAAAAATAARAAPVAATPPARTGGRLQRVGRWLALGGAAVAATSLSVLALAMVAEPEGPTPQQQAKRAEALLASAGLTAIRVAVDDGQLVAGGYLDTVGQRTRAERLLAAQGLPVRMDVWVNETIAQAIGDVYRVHGVQAEVRPTAAGAMRVRTALVDPAPLAVLERIVRADVPGLAALEVVNEPPRRPPSPVPALDDAGKRVAAIVAGAEPYVSTADGTRYFVGALLPTGHRIVAIDGRRVDLEREGEQSAITF